MLDGFLSLTSASLPVLATLAEKQLIHALYKLFIIYTIKSEVGFCGDTFSFCSH